MSSNTSVRGRGLGYSSRNNVDQSVVVVEEYTRARHRNDENDVTQNVAILEDVARTRIDDRVVDRSSVENEGEIIRQDIAASHSDDDTVDEIEVLGLSEIVRPEVIDLTESPAVRRTQDRRDSLISSSNHLTIVDLTDSPNSSVHQKGKKDDASGSMEAVQDRNGRIGIHCPICLESASEFDNLKVFLVSTKCGHLFCSRCLPISIRTSGCCPTCRRKLFIMDYHRIFL